MTVPIQIINDNLPEPTETFVFSLITSLQDATIGVPRTSRVSILDDETPAPPPNPEPPLTSNYNVTPVSLVHGLNQPVRFVFSPVNPSQVYVAEKPGVIALSDLTTGTTRTVHRSEQPGERRRRSRAARHRAGSELRAERLHLRVRGDRSAGHGRQDRQCRAGRRSATATRRSSATPPIPPPTSPPSCRTAPRSCWATRVSPWRISAAAARRTSPIPHSATRSVRTSSSIPNAATPPTVINGFKQDYLKVDSSSHAGGHLNFGPDGKLYVSVGEGSSFNYADPHSLNVQSLDSLSGKILRIDPATGLGLSDNPFVTGGVALDSDRAKVYQLGLRNPFSVAFAPDGRLFIADTGWNSWEEIDSGGPGANFGWPFYEGGDGGVSAANARLQRHGGRAGLLHAGGQRHRLRHGSASAHFPTTAPIPDSRTRPSPQARRSIPATSILLR